MLGARRAAAGSADIVGDVVQVIVDNGGARADNGDVSSARRGIFVNYPISQLAGILVRELPICPRERRRVATRERASDFRFFFAFFPFKSDFL